MAGTSYGEIPDLYRDCVTGTDNHAGLGAPAGASEHMSLIHERHAHRKKVEAESSRGFDLRKMQWPTASGYKPGSTQTGFGAAHAGKRAFSLHDAATGQTSSAASPLNQDKKLDKGVSCTGLQRGFNTPDNNFPLHR